MLVIYWGIWNDCALSIFLCYFRYFCMSYDSCLPIFWAKHSTLNWVVMVTSLNLLQQWKNFQFRSLSWNFWIYFELYEFAFAIQWMILIQILIPYPSYCVWITRWQVSHFLFPSYIKKWHVWYYPTKCMMTMGFNQ